jgi:nicotinamidase-related amidase
MARALVVIDVQKAFLADRDAGYPWANPAALERIAELLADFRARGEAVVHVHHHGTDPADSFHPANPLSVPIEATAPTEGERVVIKQGSSAFIGTGLAGGAANYCVESTARMAGNLGFATTVVGDALINFQKTLRDGRVMPPGDVLAMTLANLDGEFASIATTDEVLSGQGG